MKEFNNALNDFFDICYKLDHSLYASEVGNLQEAAIEACKSFENLVDTLLASRPSPCLRREIIAAIVVYSAAFGVNAYSKYTPMVVTVRMCDDKVRRAMGETA